MPKYPLTASSPELSADLGTVSNDRLIGRDSGNSIVPLRASQVQPILKWDDVISPPQITSDQTGWTPAGWGDARRVRMTSDAVRTIQGLLWFSPNVWANYSKRLYNVGSFDIILANQNGGAALETYRILNYTGANITLQPDDNIEVWYDETTQRWRTG